jgi:hypothetical protein
MTKERIEAAAKKLYEFTGRMAMVDDKTSAVSAIEKEIIQQVNAAIEEVTETMRPHLTHAELRKIRALKIKP